MPRFFRALTAWLVVGAIAANGVAAQGVPVTPPNLPAPPALLDFPGQAVVRDPTPPQQVLIQRRDQTEQTTKQEQEVSGAALEPVKPLQEGDQKALSKDKDKATQDRAPQARATITSSSATSPQTLFDLGTNEQGKTRDDTPTKEKSPPFNGSFTHEVKLEIPEFRGLEPQLSLTYDSNAGQQSSGYWSGMVGTGWRFRGMSDIVRTSRIGGAPRFDATDVFSLDGEELLACDATKQANGQQSPSASCTAQNNASNSYSTRTESYQRIRFIPATYTFEVTRTDGVRAIYKPTASFVSASQIAATPYVLAYEARWVLANLIDTSGNTIYYDYYCPQLPVCYLGSIAYSQKKVTFQYGVGQAFTMGNGVGISTINARLNSVRTVHNNQTIAAYGLTYETSPTTSVARLKSVHRYGKDAVIGADGIVTGPLAAYGETFAYNGNSLWFSGVSSPFTGGPPTGSPFGGQILWGDFDGDGRKDALVVQFTSGPPDFSPFGLACTEPDGTWLGPFEGTFTFSLRRSNGSGFDAPVQTHSIAIQSYCPFTADPSSWSVGDVNGDGKDDIVGFWSTNWMVRVPGESDRQEVRYEGRALLNIGVPSYVVSTQIESSAVDASLVQVFGSPYLGLHDVDGDGRADLVRVGAPNGGQFPWGPQQISVWENGTGWRTLGNYSGGGAPTIADFNGDGKADFASFSAWQPSGVVISLQLSNGTTLGAATQTTIPVPPGDQGWTINHSSNPGYLSGSAGPPPYAGIGDFNGDGRTDLLVIRTYAAGAAAPGQIAGIDVLVSTGSGFALQNWHGPAAIYPNALECSQTSSASCPLNISGIGDVDGDGRTDFVVNGYTGSANQAIVFLSRPGTGGGNGSFTQFGTGRNERVIRVADISGDGRGDILFGVSPSFPGGYGEPSSPNDVASFMFAHIVPHLIYIPGGDAPDLLFGLTSMWGGQTTLSYLPSSAWLNGRMSGVRQTVRSLTQYDAVYPVRPPTWFSYAGGLYDARERRFLGFQTVHAQLPCNSGETVCPLKQYTFRQDYATAGKLVRLEHRDTNNALYRTEAETYDRTEAQVMAMPAPYRAVSTQSDTIDYLISGTRTLTDVRAFDIYNNVTYLYEAGDTARADDDRANFRYYSADTANYIVDRLTRHDIADSAAPSATTLQRTYYWYDSRGLMTSAGRQINAANDYVYRSAHYDALGNRLWWDDENSNRTSFIYDTTEQLYVVETRTPLYNNAGDTRMKALQSWDAACGKPLTSTNFDGLVTTMTYDPYCRLTLVAKPGGDYESTVYVNIGLPGASGYQAIVVGGPGPQGHPPIWKRSYLDGFGRTYVEDTSGPSFGVTDVTKYIVYSNRGPVAASLAPYRNGENAPQAITRIEYDALDREVRRTNPDGSFSTISRHYTGNYLCTVRQDEIGRISWVWENARRLPVIVSKQGDGGQNPATQYNRDRLDRLYLVVAPNGAQYGYVYDMASRRLTASDPDFGQRTYVYDPAGRMLQQTDARGFVTKMTYDAMGRVLTKIAGFGTAWAETTTSTYDQDRAGTYNRGKLTTIANAAASIAYDYDLGGRKIAERWTVDGQTHALGMGYDIGGRLLWKSYPDGDSIGSASSPWTYDGAGRLLSIPGHVSSYLYNASGQVTAVYYANGAITGNSYDPLRRWLTSTTTAFNGGYPVNNAYGRDLLGRITSVWSVRSGDKWTYSYNLLGFLTAANNTDDPTLSQSFSYDISGRMLSNSRVGTYSYPAVGSPHPHAPTQAGGFSFTYDAGGNLITGAQRSYVWDAENRPLSVTMATTGVTISHVYGPDGSRLKLIEPSQTTLFLGKQAERAGADWTKYGNADVKRKGNAGAATPEFLHRDHLASVRAVSSTAATPVQASVYRPFGERVITAGTAAVERQAFIGEQQDASTGLLYLNARFYDPYVASFVSPDVLDPDKRGVGTNRYSYSLNDPINLADKNGQQAGDNSNDNDAGGRGTAGGQEGAGGINASAGLDGTTAGYTGVGGAIVGAVAGFALEGWDGIIPGAIAGSRLEDAGRALAGIQAVLSEEKKEQKPDQKQAPDFGPLTEKAKENKIAHALPDRKTDPSKGHKDLNQTAVDTIKAFDGDKSKAYNSIQEAAQGAYTEGKISFDGKNINGIIDTPNGRIGVYGDMRAGSFSLNGITKP